jgi:hypothetical protein
MQLLTVECICGGSFVVTESVLEDALRYPSAPFITCRTLVGKGNNGEICKRRYSAAELKKFLGRVAILYVKDEKDVELEFK